MKFAFYGLLVFFSGCKIQDTVKNPLAIQTPKTNSTVMENLKNGTGHQASFVERGLAKIEELFHALDGRTPFCRALLETSPTREEYIRNWQPSDGGPAYCPGSNHVLESCNKKHDDAFEAGLLCYKSNIFLEDAP